MPTYNVHPQRQATVDDALEQLLEHTTKRVRDGVRSPHTLAMQSRHAAWMRDFQLPPELGSGRLGDVLLAHLVAPVLIALIEWWHERGGVEGGELGLRTIAKRASTLRRSLRLAVGRGELERLPQFPEIALPPEQPRLRILRSHDELRLLLSALSQRRREWVAVALWTCQRPGDTERMCWSDVDLLSTPKSMLIRSTKTRKPHGVRVRCPGPLVSVLTARLARLEAAGKKPAPSDPLVDRWPGVSKTLPVVAVRLGLPPMSAMDLRHTGFSWMIRRTGITEAARQWGGWSSFTMLCRHYAHALPPGLEQATAELESMAANDNDGEGS